ncbi:MAG: electron transfer flavoprotein subunit alpha/FixB family protein [Elusimicrobia bacterium]|nr:electron transfer flavoprotein subunit alpha/FixB family protein [Elusimicrobiota bacterium]
MSEIDLTQYKGVWCFGEVRHGKLVTQTYELLTIGSRIAKELNEKLSVVLVGHNLQGWTQELLEAGAEKIYLLDHPELENFTDEAYTKALAELAAKEKPNKILIPATTVGRSMAGRLATILHTGAIADVTDLTLGPGTNGAGGRALNAIRPTYGGNLFVTVRCEKCRPEIITVRPMSFPKAARTPGKIGEIVNVPINPSSWNLKTKVVSYAPEQSSELDIGSADKIVSGGRGLGKPDNFNLVRSLAKALGAAVGSSRPPVDSGWIPYRHQVGLTGRTVKPKLYVACGISGQIQHLAGMGQADTIIAINRDPECQLMKMATFSVEADLNEFIPLLVEEIGKQKN